MTRYGSETRLNDVANAALELREHPVRRVDCQLWQVGSGGPQGACDQCRYRAHCAPSRKARVVTSLAGEVRGEERMGAVDVLPAEES